MNNVPTSGSDHNVDIQCPNCGGALRWDVAAAHETITCPHCKEIVQIPEFMLEYAILTKPATDLLHQLG